MGKRGLGRGLSALIATGEGVGGLKFEELPVSAIRPNSRQPRNSFPEAGIQGARRLHKGGRNPAATRGALDTRRASSS